MSHRLQGPEALQQRLVSFGIAVCRNLRRLKRDPVVDHFSRQLVRSSTSPAANYAEARAIESRRDFVHKMQIGLKELRETSVWLQFVTELVGEGPDRTKLKVECNELIGIVVASLKTARRDDARNTAIGN